VVDFDALSSPTFTPVDGFQIHAGLAYDAYADSALSGAVAARAAVALAGAALEAAGTPVTDISFTIESLPNTVSIRGQVLGNLLPGLLLYFSLTALLSVSPLPIELVVKWRGTGFKHLLHTHGLGFSRFWHLVLACDLIFFVVLNLVFGLGVMSLASAEFVLNNPLALSAIAFSVMAAQQTVVAHLLAFPFDKVEKVRSVTQSVLMIFGLIPFLIYSIGTSFVSLPASLSFLIDLVPFAAPYHSLAVLNAAGAWEGPGLTFAQAFSFSTEYANNFVIPIIIAIVETVAVWFAIIAIDHRKLRGKAALPIRPGEEMADINNDPDVIAAARSAFQSGPNAPIVQVRAAYKIYPGAAKLAKTDASAATAREGIPDYLDRALPGGRPAARSVAFSVRKGEIFGLLGRNGAGKTTTLDMMTCRHPVSAGDILIAGKSVSHPKQVLPLVGFAPQHDDALQPFMTPREHIHLLARLHGRPEAAEETLTASGFTSGEGAGYADMKVSDLSGGWKRRATIAVALSSNPSVLLLDEISAGVDPLARRGIWEVVRRLAADRAVVLTSHSLNEIERLCTTIAIMKDGRMRIYGSTGHVKQRFGASYRLTVSGPNARSVTETVARLVPAAEPTAQGAEMRSISGTVHFAVPVEHLDLPTVFETLSAAKNDPAVPIDAFSLAQPSLEQVFLAYS
jgi:ABC-type multidrug transport system ATPase subunit